MTIEFATPLPLADRQLSALPRLKIAGLILLRGLVRATELSKTVMRSVLDLPIDDGRTLMTHWMSAAADLCSACERESLPLRLLLDQSAPKPNSPPKSTDVSFSIENDPFDFRGTGGVLRDLSAQYDQNSLLVVANAAQVLFSPLPHIVSTLAATGADIATIVHQDGSPVTLMLIRCGCMLDLPDVGFIDMKEQALCRLARQHRVHACSFDQPLACSVRTGDSYIHALRAMHADRIGPSRGLLDEDWQSLFEIVEPGATVDPSARLHDSVVLSGANVGKGTALIRSILGPGGVVPADAVVVDSLISAGGSQPLGDMK